MSDEQVTVAKLRLAYPELTEQIENEAKAPVLEQVKVLTEERDAVTKERDTAQEELGKLKAEGAERQKKESIRKLFNERAEALKVDASKMTEERISKLIPHVMSVEEDKRADEIDGLIKQFIDTGKPGKHLGTRQSVAVSTEESLHDDPDNKPEDQPEGYVKLGAEGAAAAMTAVA